MIVVLEVGDGVFEVLSTSGDTHLGGDDFDKVDLVVHPITCIKSFLNYIVLFTSQKILLQTIVKWRLGVLCPLIMVIYSALWIGWLQILGEMKALISSKTSKHCKG
jgi:hypothetical protein